MTDNGQWQAPGGSGVPSSGPPPVPPAPVSGYAPAPYSTPSPAQAPYQQSAPSPGWTPPPKPGLIPLRPLDFGTILGAPYQLLRRNPRPTFGVSLLLQGGTFFLTAIVVGIVAFLTFSRVDFAASTEEEAELLSGAFAITILSAIIPVTLSLVATGLLQGILVLEVARQSVGDRLRFPELWARAKGRVWAVAGYTALLFVVLILAMGVLVGIVIGLSLLGDAGLAAGIAIAVLLYLAMLVAGAWIGTKLAFVPSVIMLEKLSIRNAIARSWTLTNRAFWKTFGTLLLVAFIINTATSIITVPVQLLASFLPALFAPTGDMTAIIVAAAIAYLVLIIVTLVVSAVAVVIQSATTALLYLDQRIRKEGLDLDLARYVEARQAGDTGVPDPYETVRTAPGAPTPSDSPWA